MEDSVLIVACRKAHGARHTAHGAGRRAQGTGEEAQASTGIADREGGEGWTQGTKLLNSL